MFGQRAHIVPIRRKVELATEPAVKQDIDVVHLIPDKSIDGDTSVEPVIDELNKHGIDHDVHPCAHDDLYVVMGLVTTLANAYEGEHDSVFVNIATGSRVAAVGGALACMDSDTPARAFDIDADRGEGVHELISGNMLPDHVIQSPDWQLVAGLAIIKSINAGPAKTKKRHLIDHGLRLSADPNYETEFISLENVVETLVTDDPDAKQELIENGFDAVGNQRNSAYNHVDSGIVKPLKKRGYIEVQPLGRSKHLTVTQDGENVLRAFRHKIEDVIAFEEKQRQYRGGSLEEWLLWGFTNRSTDHDSGTPHENERH